MTRSYRYTPSPPRGYRRRGQSRSPGDRYGRRGRDLPTSLLVRNLRLDCRTEDLRKPFGQFGPLKDIYLPRDYYTGEPRGFGFVQYVDPDDAADAKYQMDGQILLGRELTVVFAEENRKKPTDMRARERISGRSDGYRRSPIRSRSRYSRSPRYSRPRSRYRSYSRSRSPRYSRSPPSRSPSYYSPSPRRRNSRSVSPHDGKHHRERSYTSRSPPYSRSRSRSPLEEYTTRKRSLRQRSPSVSSPSYSR